MARGPVHVMDTLVASHVTSRPHLPLTLLAAHNVSVAALNKQGEVSSSMVLSKSPYSEVSSSMMLSKSP